MLDKYIYNFLHWIMGWSGKLNAWAWRKHVKMIEDKREKEDEEYLRQMQAQNEASYFSTQGQALLASTGADNYSRSGTGINFLDTSAFNPEMEPSSQYLNMRGLPTTIDPRDAPGYGFDYEAFLREQMVA